jgi:hypothetical protein
MGVVGDDHDQPYTDSPPYDKRLVRINWSLTPSISRSATASAAIKSANDYGVVGQNTARIELADKVSKYADLRP